MKRRVVLHKKDNAGKTVDVKTAVKYCNSWSSSFSRRISAAGRAASNAAIRRAAKAGISISYLENGVVVSSNPIENHQ